MTELKNIVAKNIATLRIAAHLTQFELGEKLSYSDKAVSRWERGEAIPDAYVLLKMASIFGVTVDFILTERTEEELEVQVEPEDALDRGSNDRHLATLISFLGVWAFALLVFVIASISGRYLWISFIYAIPTSFILLFIFNCIWGRRPFGILYLSAAVWGLLLSVHLSTLAYANSWMIYLVGIPAQIIIPIAFSFGKHKKR